MYNEFNNVVNKARKGDLESVADILDRLRPLLIAQIKRYYNKRSDYEDLISQGNLVILESLKSFDESRGVKFLGYVKCQLMYSYLDKHKEKVHVSLNTPISDEGAGEMIDLLISDYDGPLDLFLDLEKNIELYEAVNSLSNRQKQIITMFYIKGMTIPQISEELGIAYRTVVNIKATALKNMKKALKDRFF